jgi:F-type H+-transporting ATPase subunit b
MKFNIWTLLFQIINFIVLLVILRRILYKPIRQIMEKRRGLIEREMRDAERTKSEAQALKDKYQEEMNGLKNQKARMLEAVQGEVSEERKRLIDKAGEDAERIIAREKALENAEKRTFEAEMKDKMLDSVSIFSSNLLKDIADETLHEAVLRKFIAGLERHIQKIALAVGNEETISIDLSTAYPLHDEDIEKVQDIVQSRVGKKVAVGVTLEPAIIAGVRMKAGDQVIDSSLAGQIQALKERLKETA